MQELPYKYECSVCTSVRYTNQAATWHEDDNEGHTMHRLW
jgi:hypothetical protein